MIVEWLFLITEPQTAFAFHFSFAKIVCLTTLQKKRSKDTGQLAKLFVFNNNNNINNLDIVFVINFHPIGDSLNRRYSEFSCKQDCGSLSKSLGVSTNYFGLWV